MPTIYRYTANFYWFCAHTYKRTCFLVFEWIDRMCVYLCSLDTDEWSIFCMFIYLQRLTIDHSVYWLNCNLKLFLHVSLLFGCLCPSVFFSPFRMLHGYHWPMLFTFRIFCASSYVLLHSMRIFIEKSALIFAHFIIICAPFEICLLRAFRGVPFMQLCLHFSFKSSAFD